MHGHAVVDPVGRIDPEVGRHLARRAERYQHAAGHVLLGQPQLRRQDAVDVQAQLRPVRQLLEVNVGDARDIGDLAAQFLRYREAAGPVDADHLHVDGGGQAEVENLARDIGRLEEKGALRKALRQLAAQPIDVVRSRLVLRVQGHQDLAVSVADGAIVDVRHDREGLG